MPRCQSDPALCLNPPTRRVALPARSALRLRLDAGNRARAILAQKNYRLVVACAKWACKNGVGGGGAGSGHDGSYELAFEDALTAGMEGLMRGIHKFRPDSGYRLSTYCTWWIRMSIRKTLSRQSTALQ